MFALNLLLIQIGVNASNAYKRPLTPTPYDDGVPSNSEEEPEVESEPCAEDHPKGVVVVYLSTCA